MEAKCFDFPFLFGKVVNMKNVKKQGHIRYTLIFRPEAEGGFTVTVPSLPGCITYGKTLSSAKSAARDAVAGYLVSLKKHRRENPLSDEDSLIGAIDLKGNRSYA